mmetsp:Transcript_40712/g.65374  ORF Transcript_40712/g.65374 Transcript_40712/m.65374 type:complete len:509 (-) Transcript_40712:149-1675(-)|eukprot:CAMPEP_0203755482 /NCGR_PEP_ID=MMETSP0098-20131031/8922_1 /ASSEMBLY_ACC=CAM_ASM_000208 /TAXON_ID=96639 /ORGANISM=" , Strain NY0313808BC1" /LENGTH=508 /DNA_ID=CAMNT_0050646955 /DNA_START=230 /DNA_END=1756 /DNA_ORIENTATION=-
MMLKVVVGYLLVGAVYCLGSSNETTRLEIKGSMLYRNNVQVTLAGTNYVMKGYPFFPNTTEVEAHAQQIAASMKDLRKNVAPVVRLGTLMSGYMPYDSTVSEEFKTRLESTVGIFNKHGIYVLLDIHTDAMVSTACGQGISPWVAQYFQENQARIPWWKFWATKKAYLASPATPLKLCGSLVGWALKAFGHVPEVQTVSGDTNPWYNYSTRDSGRISQHGQFMNIGNQNCRLNNNDVAWGKGTILFTEQLQNFAARFYSLGHSPVFEGDNAHVYKHYLGFVKYLSQVHKENSNVVGIELLNEPPIVLQSLLNIPKMRRNLFKFYAKVIEDLGSDTVPIVVEDLGGSLPGASVVWNVFRWFNDIDASTLKKLQEKSDKNQLMLSFHYYKTVLTSISMDKMIGEVAAKASKKFNNAPMFLTEFDQDTQGIAKTIATILNQHNTTIAATTYWHYKNMFSPTDIFNEGTTTINQTLWPSYVESIDKGESYGAQITGSGGGNDQVLGNLENYL